MDQYSANGGGGNTGGTVRLLVGSLNTRYGQRWYLVDPDVIRLLVSGTIKQSRIAWLEEHTNFNLIGQNGIWLQAVVRSDGTGGGST